jgi:hypothetical protein
MRLEISRKRFLFLGLAVVLLALLGLAGTVLAQRPDGGALVVPAGGPNEVYAFTYQGRLDDGGRPANGVYDFIVQLWTQEVSGTLAADCINVNDVNGLDDQVVSKGLFTFHLVCGANWDNSEVFAQPRLWIQVSVRPDGVGPYTELPRQAIAPTPYAWSLYPGAIISSTYGGTAFGDAMLNLSSAGGHGLYAIGASSGVRAETTGGSINDYGVYGTGGGLAYGVYGYQSSSTLGGLGVYGRNEGGGSGVSGLNASTGNGTWGYSYDANGVGSATGRGDNNYGLYTEDNLFSLNFHSLGATMQVVQNGGSATLEYGDVVVIDGMGPAPVEGLPPILQVRRAEGANSTAVLGVVASTYSPAWMEAAAAADPTGASDLEELIPLMGPGPIAPGEYLLVVVRGPCEVKADAAGIAIQPGDLLSTAAQGGYADRATEVRVDGLPVALPGTVLGKALAPLEAGRQGLLYVYVTLQ